MVASLLALLLVSGDFGEAREALKDAVDRCDAGAIDKAAQALARLDKEGCAGALADAFDRGIHLLASLRKERDQCRQDIETYAVPRDEHGGIIDPGAGNSALHLKAKRGFAEAVRKVAALEDSLSGMMRRTLLLSSPEAARGLGLTLARAEEPYARAACAEALGRLDPPQNLDRLVAHARKERDPGVRVALARAIGERAAGKGAAPEILTQWLKDRFWQVQLAAARALARTGDRSQTWQLIDLLKGASGRLREEVNAVLCSITGVDKHGSHDAWHAWWEAHREEFIEGRHRAPAAEQAGIEGATTFYGIPVSSTRLVFLVDASSSMLAEAEWRPDVKAGEEPLEGTSRLDVAKHQLRKIVRALPDGARFNILIVSGKIEALGGALVRADESGRKRAVRFIDGIESRAGTDLFGGISRALEFGAGDWNGSPDADSIDTIYLLTDGQANVGVTHRERLVERVADAVRYKNIAVHAVAVAAPLHGKKLLQRIAEETGGRFIER